jgi:hypothetical protein
MRWQSHRAANVATGSETQGIDNLAIADVGPAPECKRPPSTDGGSQENPIVATLLDDSTTKTPILL